MDQHIGKKLLFRTEKGILQGILKSYDSETGKIYLQENDIVKEIDVVEVVDVQEIQDGADSKNLYTELKEADMYSLFEEAFTIYGPLEDNFISAVAISLKKFLKDISSSRIRIIIGSDDVFGRIGLCFARLMQGKALQMDVCIECSLRDIKSLTYYNLFINSGGILSNSKELSGKYSMTLFAANRHFDFKLGNCISEQSIVMDLSDNITLPIYTCVGLGYAPEHSKSLVKYFYLVDVGFGQILCDKYNLYRKYKNSLIKVDMNFK